MKLPLLKTLLWTELAAYIITPIALLLLPADMLDNQPSLCPSVLVFDKECFFCGITRALLHLIHFEFSEAWTLHKMSFLVLPVLVVAIVFRMKKIWQQLRTKTQ